MMKFVRNNNFSKNKKNIHLGPYPNGYFWALEDANDLPFFHVQMEVDYALLHGTVYMQNAEKVDGWKQVTNSKELEMFKVDWADDSNHQCFKKYVLPYMPEFYIVPNETIEGFKIRALAGDYPQQGQTVDLYCPQCEEITLWDSDRFPNQKIKCLDCGTSISIEEGETVLSVKEENENEV